MSVAAVTEDLSMTRGLGRQRCRVGIGGITKLISMMCQTSSAILGGFVGQTL